MSKGRFEKTTCTAKGLDAWLHEKTGKLVYKYCEPGPKFETQTPVYRWGKKAVEPRHDWDEGAFERAKKRMDAKSALSRGLKVRKKPGDV